MSDRRGVELSINTVILIVLGLVVAVVLIYLITTSVRNANEGVTACEQKGPNYRCAQQCTEDEVGVGGTFFSGGCADGQICCQREPI